MSQPVIRTWVSLAGAVFALLLTGCTNKAVTGSEAALVPVTAELKLGYKVASPAEQQRLHRKARGFMSAQLGSGAERIEVIAFSKQGKRLQARLKKGLGIRDRHKVAFRVKQAANPDFDLVIRASRVQLIIPTCPPLGAYNSWDMQDGCFTERARSRSLVTPSALLPVKSEMSNGGE